MNKYTEITECPITGDSSRVKYLDLGDMPLVNNLNDSKNESLSCERFPLAVQLFTKSSLSTLTVEVNPNILYKHYLYSSSVSPPYADHCKEMFDFVDLYLNLTSSDYVLDIGGNDGTLLKTFLTRKKFLNVLNVDPAKNLIEKAQSENIPSINDFWSSKLAKTLNKKFKLITTTNCFQHTLPAEDFVYAISLSLENWGIWCLEFPYWKNSIDTNQFDQVYHEHVYYYMLNPINDLLSKYNLRIIKITHHDIHGGTVRLLISKIGDMGFAWQPCPYSVEPRLEIDRKAYSVESYIHWGKKIKSVLNNSSEFLISLREKGAKIVGFGAAAKGCVFLNSIGVTDEIISYIVDDTALKQYKFVPGIGIQILPRSVLKEDTPDYIVVLAHNFSKYIIESLKNYGYKNKFITLLPNEIKVYD